MKTRTDPFGKTAFYLAVSLIILGVGFLKPNISAIVGQLYPTGDPRRDSGFTLYYYGINLGAFWASVLIVSASSIRNTFPRFMTDLWLAGAMRYTRTTFTDKSRAAASFFSTRASWR